MENKDRIKGLTLLYEDNEQALHKGLMLRYVNGDFSFDIEQKIDYELEILKEKRDRTVNYANSCADFAYWKYLFLSCKDSKYYDMKKALNYLKEAVKKGSPDAMAQYGYYYYVGEVITKTKDKNKAKKFFDKAFQLSKHRSLIKQETPFVEYLYAEAMESEAGRDKTALREVVKYYEIALKKKKVLLCKKKLAKIYIFLGEKIQESVKMLEESCDAFELAQIVKDLNSKKGIR